MADSTLKHLGSRKKLLWPGGPSIEQRFALPYSIIKYLALNPSSSECYMKLIQSCKFFFEKNPIIVVKHLSHGKNCEKDQVKCGWSKRNLCTGLNIRKTVARLWIVETLSFNYAPDDEKISSMLCNKIFHCGDISLTFFDQNTAFEDFKVLSASAKKVSIVQSKIFNNDGSEVMVPDILGSLTNVEVFDYSFYFGDSLVNDESIGRNIIKLENHHMLKRLTLRYTPEIFGLKDLAQVVKAHPDMKIVIGFSDEISDEYKIQVDGLIDNFIESNVSNCLIDYEGHDEDKWNLLLRMWKNS